jgi:hypothetical protein
MSANIPRNQLQRVGIQPYDAMLRRHVIMDPGQLDDIQFDDVHFAEWADKWRRLAAGVVDESAKATLLSMAAKYEARALAMRPPHAGNPGSPPCSGTRPPRKP